MLDSIVHFFEVCTATQWTTVNIVTAVTKVTEVTIVTVITVVIIASILTDVIKLTKQILLHSCVAYSQRLGPLVLEGGEY